MSQQNLNKVIMHQSKKLLIACSFLVFYGCATTYKDDILPFPGYSKIKSDIYIKVLKVENAKLNNMGLIEFEINNRSNRDIGISQIIMCISLEEFSNGKKQYNAHFDLETNNIYINEEIYFSEQRNGNTYTGFYTSKKFCSNEVTERITPVGVKRHSSVSEEAYFPFDFPYKKDKRYKCPKSIGGPYCGKVNNFLSTPTVNETEGSNP